MEKHTCRMRIPATRLSNGTIEVWRSRLMYLQRHLRFSDDHRSSINQLFQQTSAACEDPPRDSRSMNLPYRPLVQLRKPRILLMHSCLLSHSFQGGGPVSILSYVLQSMLSFGGVQYLDEYGNAMKRALDGSTSSFFIKLRCLLNSFGVCLQ